MHRSEEMRPVDEGAFELRGVVRARPEQAWPPQGASSPAAPAAYKRFESAKACRRAKAIPVNMGLTDGHSGKIPVSAM